MMSCRIVSRQMILSSTTRRRRCHGGIFQNVRLNQGTTRATGSRYLSSISSFNNNNNKNKNKNKNNIHSSSSLSDRLVVVGSGVAGSATALIAAEKYKIPVSLVFAGSIPEDCNSYWAQGGIIYENYKHGDSPQLLAQDIFRAGAGLCVEDAVYKLAHEGPSRVKELLLQGHPYAQVPFDTTTKQSNNNDNNNDSDNELSLCLEASHAVPRILHYADHTGKVITQHITAAAAQHPLITLVPDTLVTDLIVDQQDGTATCVGIETLNKQTNTTSQMYASRGTVLCAGGLGGIYQHSTNPAGFNALGSSVALVERTIATATTSTCTLQNKDLEYVQFHPTSLYIPNEARFLLSEALRGEGALLRNGDGYAFAKDFHPDGELAPRDIVARGVFNESQKGGGNGNNNHHNVFLDITHRDANYLVKRFPTIQTHLQSKGLDITKDHLPVIPAAHYTCGGIATDLHGKTGLTNLYAAGEAARTGLHGGNRLASTSLLEGLVYGAAVADYCGSQDGIDIHQEVQRKLQSDKKKDNNDASTTMTLSSRLNKNQNPDRIVSRATTLLQTVRRVMWDHVGVVRTPSGIAQALDTLDDLIDETQHLYSQHACMETVGARDAAFAGQAVARAAFANRVSAGAHCILQDDDDEKVHGGGSVADTDMETDTDSDDEMNDVGVAVAVAQ